MKFETVKSIILFMLVGLSLLLTLGLWNNSPTYERLDDSSYLNEVDVGGEKEPKREIIEPSEIIFSSNDQYFGFDKQKKQKRFYKEMNTWSMNNFVTGPYLGEPKSEYHINLYFPAPVPIEFLPNLFDYNEEVFLPSWSFQKVYVTVNQNKQTLQLKFVSTDGVYEATTSVNDTKTYEQVKQYFLTGKDLANYESFNDGMKPIYVPENSIEMTRWSLTVNMIDELSFVEALFSNPSSVRKNTAAGYYSDAQRGMRISNDRLNMQFINPIPSQEEQLDTAELLDRSITKINGHKGWTGDFNLYEVDTKNQTVRYRMFYEGFPILNDKNLATIEQRWRDNELYNYRRPLFELTSPLANDTVKMPSGQAILNALENDSTYNKEEIGDIKLGYRLEYSESYNAASLEPAWFMNYESGWIELQLDALLKKEGNE